MAFSPLSPVRMRITSSTHAHTGNAGDGKIFVYQLWQINAKGITTGNYDGGKGPLHVSAKEELRMHGEDRIIQMCTRSALSFRLRMSDRSLATSSPASKGSST